MNDSLGGFGDSYDMGGSFDLGGDSYDMGSPFDLGGDSFETGSSFDLGGESYDMGSSFDLGGESYDMGNSFDAGDSYEPFGTGDSFDAGDSFQMDSPFDLDNSFDMGEPLEADALAEQSEFAQENLFDGSQLDAHTPQVEQPQIQQDIREVPLDLVQTDIAQTEQAGPEVVTQEPALMDLPQVQQEIPDLPPVEPVPAEGNQIEQGSPEVVAQEPELGDTPQIPDEVPTPIPDPSQTVLDDEIPELVIEMPPPVSMETDRTGRPETAYVIGYGAPGLESSGPTVVVKGEDGNLDQFSQGMNEQMIVDNVESYTQRLQDSGIRTVPLLNMSNEQIAEAIKQDRATHPDDFSTPPLAIVHGHGSDVDGEHRITYHEVQTPDAVPEGAEPGTELLEAKPVDINTIDTLKAIDQGLGGETPFCVLGSSCSSGSLPTQVANEPSLQNEVIATIATSRADQLSWGNENGEFVTDSFLNAFDSEAARRMDPTPDGKFTAADYLTNNPQFKGSQAIVDRVHLPFNQGTLPVDVPSHLPKPINVGPLLEGGQADQVVTQDGSWLNADYRIYDFPQNPVAGGNPEDLVLSEYPVAPAEKPAAGTGENNGE